MALFNEQELREYARQHPRPTIAIAYSDLGHGDATHILSSWAIELKNYAIILGYSVVDISGPNLTYERMTQILQETKPAVLFNFSHGCQTYLIGNDMRCSITRGFEDASSCGICGMPSNLKVISGVGIVAFSCHSAYQLGKCCIAAGSPFYIGFSDSLIVVSDKYNMQSIFRDSLLPLAARILEGWSVGAAVEATRNDLLDTVKLYKVVELISVPLWYNRKYLTQLGSPNWRLF